jgi:hypothetical protein
MPVHRAAFTAGGAKVVLAGRRRFFYLLDVESQAVERLASLRVWRDEKSFESFVTSQQSPQPSEGGGGGPSEGEGEGTGRRVVAVRVTPPAQPADTRLPHLHWTCSCGLFRQRGPRAARQPAHEAGEGGAGALARFRGPVSCPPRRLVGLLPS